MAYAGNKSSYSSVFQAFDLPKFSTIVDAFWGSGGATEAVIKSYPGEYHTIAGESFPPLRSLIENPLATEQLQSLAAQTIEHLGLESWNWKAIEDEYGIRQKFSNLLNENDDPYNPASQELKKLAHFWEDWRTRLRKGERKAFVVLQALGHANSMRHGKKRHNILPQMSKIAALYCRGSYINPLNFIPDEVHCCWDDAIAAAKNRDLLILDPPYVGADKIYPDDKPDLCAGPPIELGMGLGYKAIVAFNYYSPGIDSLYRFLAMEYGYTMVEMLTPFRSKFNNTESRTAGKVERVWRFLPKD